MSGLCRGDWRASPSHTDSRLPGLIERMRLRREYLWTPHLSKRDLYARVLDSGQTWTPQIAVSVNLIAQASPHGQGKTQGQHGC